MKLAKLLTIAVVTANVHATEPTEADAMLMLSCAPFGIEDRTEKNPALRELNKMAIPEGVGSTFIPGPIRSGGACVREVHTMAAFGVLGVTGELCGGYQSLIDLLRQTGVQLREPTKALQPRVLAAFEDEAGRYSISIVKGRIGGFDAKQPPPAADDDGRTTSYVCLYQASGPQ